MRRLNQSAARRPLLLCHSFGLEDKPELAPRGTTETFIITTENRAKKGTMLGSASNPCLLWLSPLALGALVPEDARKRRPWWLQPSPCRSQTYLSGCSPCMVEKGERCVRVSCPLVLLRNLSDYFIPSRPVSWRYQWVCCFVLPSNWWFGPLPRSNAPIPLPAVTISLDSEPAGGMQWLASGAWGRGCSHMQTIDAGCCGRRITRQGAARDLFPLWSCLTFERLSLFFNDTCLMVSSPAVPHLLGQRHALPLGPPELRKIHLLL